MTVSDEVLEAMARVRFESAFPEKQWDTAGFEYRHAFTEAARNDLQALAAHGLAVVSVKDLRDTLEAVADGADSAEEGFEAMIAASQEDNSDG